MSLSLFCWYCCISVSLHNQETNNLLHHYLELFYMPEQHGDTWENSFCEGTLEYDELLMFYVCLQRKLSMEYQCWIHEKCSLSTLIFVLILHNSVQLNGKAFCWVQRRLFLSHYFPIHILLLKILVLLLFDFLRRWPKIYHYLLLNFLFWWMIRIILLSIDFLGNKVELVFPYLLKQN